MKALMDNDVLLKGACYRLLRELAATLCSDSDAVGVLGSARFVVPRKIDKMKLRGDRAAALKILLTFLSEAEALEPADDEQKLAADMELAAQKQGVSLQGGESLLCAILVRRALPLLATGDKRAIVAIEKLLDTDFRLAPVRGRVRCLEQLFAAALRPYGCTTLRAAVCAEPEVDKSLMVCFSCQSHAVRETTILEGLRSYIEDLRRTAGRVLAA